MCPDPDPDPASHTVNLACNDRLVGYLPVVGPGKSLAVAMVADSDSSRGRRGEQHRDKKGDHKVQRKHEKLAWSVFFSEFFTLTACRSDAMQSLLSEPNACLTGVTGNGH